MLKKNEILGEELIKFLRAKKLAGEKTYTLRAGDVKNLFDLNELCGYCKYQRSAMICQAMRYASRQIKGEHIDGKEDSTTYTMKYQL